MTDTTIITLDCGHTLLFHRNLPLVGETVLCLRCRTYKTVMHAPAEWRIKCQSCRHAAAFGAARTMAEIGAGRHRRQRGNEVHVVALFNGYTRVRVFDGRMPTLDDAMTAAEDGSPPF